MNRKSLLKLMKGKKGKNPRLKENQDYKSKELRRRKTTRRRERSDH